MNRRDFGKLLGMAVIAGVPVVRGAAKTVGYKPRTPLDVLTARAPWTMELYGSGGPVRVSARLEMQNNEPVFIANWYADRVSTVDRIAISSQCANCRDEKMLPTGPISLCTGDSIEVTYKVGGIKDSSGASIWSSVN